MQAVSGAAALVAAVCGMKRIPACGPTTGEQPTLAIGTIARAPRTEESARPRPLIKYMRRLGANSQVARKSEPCHDPRGGSCGREVRLSSGPDDESGRGRAADPGRRDVAISSSSGLAAGPAAAGDRRAVRARGPARALTTIHPIAAGDMYGIDGIDHLAAPGLLKRVIAGSYPSGPSSMPIAEDLADDPRTRSRRTTSRAASSSTCMPTPPPAAPAS